MSIGSKVKELRKRAGIYNQEELAFRLGIARQTVSSWERGVFMPNSKNLKRLAEELNTSVSYLLDGEESKEEEKECEGEVSSLFKVHDYRGSEEDEGVIAYQIDMRCSDDGKSTFMIRKMNFGRAIQCELSGCGVDPLRKLIEEVWKKAEKSARD